MIRRNTNGLLVGEYQTLIPEEFMMAVSEDTIIYLPLGAVEWHNAHLPFGTDSIKSEHLCHQLAELTGGLILPVNPWATGCTFDKRGPYPFERAVGTIALFDKHLFLSLLRAIVRGILDNGFRKLAMIAGHAGADDRHAMETVVQETSGSGGCRAVALWCSLVTEADHAGHSETLMMLGAAPHLVQLGKSYISFPYGDRPLLGDENVEKGREKIAAMVREMALRVESELSM